MASPALPAACCAALVVLMVAVADACTITGVQVGKNQVSAMNTPSKLADGTYARYGAPQVQAHFMQQSATLVPVLNTSFSCVDARVDMPVLGTPGARAGMQQCTRLVSACALHSCVRATNTCDNGPTQVGCN